MSKQSKRYPINREADLIRYIYRDEDFLIVDKPYDVRIDGDTTNTPTVASILSETDPTLPEILRNVHQLDHATSGCYCLALNRRAAAMASNAFAKRLVIKTYVAIVRGWPEHDSYKINQPIAEIPDNRYRMCLGTPENPGKACSSERPANCFSFVLYHTQSVVLPSYFGNRIKQEAYTEFLVLRRGYLDPTKMPSNSRKPLKVTLVHLLPLSGRRHQLRLHCQYLGHPIVGDWHYEREIMDYTDTFRMMLHAEKLFIPLIFQARVVKELSVDSGNPLDELVKESIDEF